MNESILPEKWIVKIEDGCIAEIQKYRLEIHPNLQFDNLLKFTYMCIRGWGHYEIDKDFELITSEQFKLHLFGIVSKPKDNTELNKILIKLLS